jgi:hypothetical protein
VTIKYNTRTKCKLKNYFTKYIKNERNSLLYSGSCEEKEHEEAGFIYIDNYVANRHDIFFEQYSDGSSEHNVLCEQFR